MATVQERSFAAMGTRARIVVVGGHAELVAQAERRIADLEARWSRFLDTSELSRLNRAGGAPCVVSPDTFALLRHLVEAWRATAGRFDPTVHDALVQLGYDRPWPFGTSEAGARSPAAAHPTGGCGEIRLDRSTRLVWLPGGIRLDPGGLGKGLAADLVADELADGGADGVLVDLGGDVRVRGDSPDGPTWRIGIERPGAPDVELARVETRDGAVATSSRWRRRWVAADGRSAHHVLDPADGRPASTHWVSATAIAARGVGAEVAATVALLDGGLHHAPGALAALLADESGSAQAIGRHPELFALRDSVA
jgi:thiamine biosynthesis lipoprotein